VKEELKERERMIEGNEVGRRKERKNVDVKKEGKWKLRESKERKKVREGTSERKQKKKETRRRRNK
jgi:hypothetical protein